MEESCWGNKSLHFWLSPTIAAITGLAITKFLPYNPFFMIAGAFVLVIVQLNILNIRDVSISISGNTSDYNPYSKLDLSFIRLYTHSNIASGKKLIDNYYNRKDNGSNFTENTKDREKLLSPKKRWCIGSNY